MVAPSSVSVPFDYPPPRPSGRGRTALRQKATWLASAHKPVDPTVMRIGDTCLARTSHIAPGCRALAIAGKDRGQPDCEQQGSPPLWPTLKAPEGTETGRHKSAWPQEPMDPWQRIKHRSCHCLATCDFEWRVRLRATTVSISITPASCTSCLPSLQLAPKGMVLELFKRRLRKVLILRSPRLPVPLCIQICWQTQGSTNNAPTEDRTRDAHLTTGIMCPQPPPPPFAGVARWYGAAPRMRSERVEYIPRVGRAPTLYRCEGCLLCVRQRARKSAQLVGVRRAPQSMRPRRCDPMFAHGKVGKRPRELPPECNVKQGLRAEAYATESLLGAGDRGADRAHLICMASGDPVSPHLQCNPQHRPSSPLS